MKPQILLLIALVLISGGLSLKPGTVIGIRDTYLNKARDQYFTILMMSLQYLSYDDIKDGSYSLKGITGSLKNQKASNCIIGFDHARNYLSLNLTSSDFKLHMNWASDQKEGVADVNGKISAIQMYLSFDTVDVNEFLYPQIHFEEASFIIADNDLTYEFECDGCSDDQKTQITNLLKGKLLDTVKNNAKDLANERVASIVNQQIKMLIPKEFPISPDITIDISSTGKINVLDGYITIPIDSTIYLNSDGYNRPIDVPDIDVIHPDNPGDMMLFTSDYVYKCLEIIMNKQALKFTAPIYGNNVTLEIDPKREPFHLESEVGVMWLRAGGIATLVEYNSYFEFSIDTKLDLDLYSGDATSMLKVRPRIIGAKFNKVIICFLGFRMDLSNSLIPFLDKMVAAVLNVALFPKLTVPKLEALPLKVSKAKLEFYDTYTELGLSFAMG